MDDDRTLPRDGRDVPGRWVPDGDTPLVRRVTERSVLILMIGVGLIAAAVAVARQLVLHPESAQVPMPVAVVLVGVIVLALGGLGVAVVTTFVRAPRHTVRIGPDGLRLGASGLRLAWDDVDLIALRVVRVRRSGSPLLSGRPRDLVLVSIVWCSIDGAVRRAGDPRPARRRLPVPFMYERGLYAPQSPGPDLPLADDVDAALRHFAGRRYRPALRA